jgi:hypothetical protein
MLRKEIESCGTEGPQDSTNDERDSLSTRYPCAGDSRSEPRTFPSMIPWNTAVFPR